MTVRLTQYAGGGGCACKIPPGELDALVATLAGDASQPKDPAAELLVGLDGGGDDAAVVRLDEERAVVTTADFFTPVVDDPYDWGRIAAANALSDVYAMGGTPWAAVNLLAWPRETLPMELAAEVLRGGRDVAHAAGCQVSGGHSVTDPEPKYGMSVVGMVHPGRMLRLDAAEPGRALTLTKPLGSGVLNARHKATGTVFPEAVAVMAELNRDASLAAVAAGVRAGTDVTGFGLLGHAYKLARASNVTVAIDAAAVPFLADARAAAEEGFVSGGTRRNLAWVEPQVAFGELPELERLLLADAQTSGGLLLAGEVPGHPVVGEVLPRGAAPVVVRG
ncbi:selenide, water dikinase SelD [Streptomyces sp. 3MP-14]|uniref:Selenide, water dikinase n=1 Tax=Streptomyces mimosae TaxID=2586635 RepID=A0A5N6ABW9_9ACTN|nr:MULTISPECIES: selenide, water dikinase SelD [Streptomyces]KAB8165745.1 selenide, water dikinase SelD [Streptomyces mimosae]KAB8176134.1 selenide, water dikinase SelD [Streptomyces sp. 3MP-14]